MLLSPYYSLIVVLAFCLSTSYFVWSFWRKNVPDLIRLLIFSIFFVPFALLGARLWNYLNWEPLRKIVDQGSWSERLLNFLGLGETGLGGLSFFGGLFAILIYFLLVFFWYSRKHQVSSWMSFDILLQGVLIFQIVGRWGNFFNQELLGQELTTDYPREFGWVPDWLGSKLHFNGESTLILRHPLFLYESFANFLLLSLLILIKKIGLIHLLFVTKRYPLLLKQITDERKRFLSRTKWLLPFFWLRKLLLVHRFWRVNVLNPNVDFNRTPSVHLNRRFGRWEWLDKSHLYQKQLLFVKQLPFLSRIKQHFWLFWRRNSNQLTNHFNPLHLLIPRVGLTTALYFVGYGVIRTVLQTFREGVEASEPITTPYYASGLLIICGLFFLCWSQFLAPRKYRSPNWFYETWYWKT